MRQGLHGGGHQDAEDVLLADGLHCLRLHLGILCRQCIVSVQTVSVCTDLADVLPLVPGGDPLQGQVIPLQHQPRVLPGNRATQF